MALPKSGITTSLVGNTLGTASRSVGALCKNVNINKWSAWKPTKYKKDTGLVDAELGYANFSFDLHSIEARSLADIFTIMNRNNDDWPYLRPQGGAASPYRLGDFRGYNHTAPELFDYHLLPKTLYTQGNTTSIELYIKKINTEIDFKKMAYFDSNLSRWRYAVAYSTGGETRFALGSTLASATNDIYIDLANLKVGTVTCVFCVTMNQSSTDMQEPCIYMPFGGFEISVVRQYSYARVTWTNFGSLTPNLTPDGIFGIWPVNFSMQNVNDIVPATNGYLRATVTLYGKDMNELITKDVDDRSNTFHYGGSGVQTATIDWNAGAGIPFNVFFPEINGYDVYHALVDFDVYVENGDGLFMFDKHYYFELSR